MYCSRESPCTDQITCTLCKLYNYVTLAISIAYVVGTSSNFFFTEIHTSMSLPQYYRAFELRLAERVSNGLQEVSLADDSEPQRTTLGGLKRQGKKGTVGTKRTGNATLCKTGNATYTVI